MAPAIPIISTEFSQIPDQAHGALTPPEHRSSASTHEQVNASWKSSETPSLNHISKPETVSLPLNEPLTSTMREETKTELRRYWHEMREEEFCRKLKWAWTSDSNHMLSIDSSLKSGDAVESRLLRKFYNKPTTLYWAHSAQCYDRCPRFIWGCICKEWFRCHDYEPRMNFEHFLANPIRITSTGPTTIFGILEAHEYLYNLTSLLLDKIRRDEFENSHMSARPSPQNLRLFPVCRAIIMVFDELETADRFDPDGFIILDEELQRQNVLMVRTGDESGLSEPIRFESVRGLALPLARPELNSNDGIEAIRVTLAKAVRFVVDLQRREELAFPESAPSSAVGRAFCPLAHHSKMRPASTTNADEWIDKLMEIADDEGVHNVREVKMAVSTVKAVHRGEKRLIEYEPPFVHNWR